MTQLIQEGSTDDVIFKNVFAVQHDGRMKVRGHEWDRLIKRDIMLDIMLTFRGRWGRVKSSGLRGGVGLVSRIAT